jgi:hypothetical protein
MWSAIVQFVLYDGEAVIPFGRAVRRWRFWALMMPCFAIGVGIGYAFGQTMLAGPCWRERQHAQRPDLEAHSIAFRFLASWATVAQSAGETSTTVSLLRPLVGA